MLITWMATTPTTVPTIRLFQLAGKAQTPQRKMSIPEIEEIVTTNTVPIPPEKRLPNMTVLSVGPIFGEALRRNLIEFGFLRRERGGGRYWVAPEEEKDTA